MDDVDAELKAVEKESEETLKQQQSLFGIGANDQPPDEDPKKDDIDE